MRSVIVPLYWLWCGVSVFILARRRITGRAGRTAAVSSTPPSSTASSSFPSTPADSRSPEREPVAAGAVPPAPAPNAVDAAHGAATVRPSAAVAVSLGVPLSSVDSLAEALEGIALPCDLAPLIGTGEFDPRRLVLTTSGVPDEIVGTAVADEMERLGYALEPLSERSILATNEQASVEIAVHRDAEIIDDTGTRRFPTAPPNAVVVDIRLR